jgi:uncharacterized protein with PQ loop repeat
MSLYGNSTSDCFPTKHGYPYIPWIHTVFGDCIYTPLEQASFWIGLSSLGFWIIAQFPQVVENFRRSDASSLSPLFLLIWALGDSTNLFGAILTGQLATQIVTAIYFFCMDIVLSGQWIYYSLKNRWLTQRRHYADEVALNRGEETKKILASVLLPLFFVSLTFFAVHSQQGEDASVVTKFIARKLLQEEPPEDNYNWPPEGFKGIFGYIIGVISAILYLTSRLPQILKNIQRGSTEGLSPILFICAFMGNFTYSLSIFLFSVHPKFLLSKLPWIAGSAGVLVLDIVVLSQFLYFNVIKKRKAIEEEEEQESIQNEQDPLVNSAQL